MTKRMRIGATRRWSWFLFFIVASQLQLCVSGAFVRESFGRYLASTCNQQPASKYMRKGRAGNEKRTRLSMIGTGLTFDDGDQLLVSAQKPLGVVLEEKEEGGLGGGVVIADISDDNSAVARAGVQIGDWLVAVQNADVSKSSIEEVMDRLGNAPRVVNLRFQRRG